MSIFVENRPKRCLLKVNRMSLEVITAGYGRVIAALLCLLRLLDERFLCYGIILGDAHAQKGSRAFLILKL